MEKLNDIAVFKDYFGKCLKRQEDLKKGFKAKYERTVRNYIFLLNSLE